MSVNSGESKKNVKKTPNDFIFGKVIGEGSYSTVYLAKEVDSSTEYAIKVLEKRHIMRERKTQYVMREKEVLMKLNHPFFIRLFFTFQDTDRLYFVLSYARRGELLDYIHKLSSFDEPCSRWYTAEIIAALDYLHTKGIIHRDLKPENILLNDEMHIQITDFGSAKILKDTKEEEEAPVSGRTNSFVGTAQYVSPEILTSKKAYYSSDLWALGCIVYQLMSGLPPFRGGHEYQIFQKITKLEYEFPDGFNVVAQDLVEKLLVLNPEQRLGCEEMGGFEKLKLHPFYEGIDFDHIHEQKPPPLVPFLPATSTNPENIWSSYRAGFDDARMVEIITQTVITDDERKKRLEEQQQNSKYHKFVEGNLILKQGLVDKRKGLFARKRMLLLTEGPHLYYVDPANQVLKGQIPWSEELRPEAKNFKTFFVHTPNRTYYLEDRESRSQDWVAKISEAWQQYYGNKNKK
ncbi:3-phosphoinositide-dependent protein kinase 1-like [Ostrea edulis]|uniref:3-phosphoinositide-dependent protein kinase 1-like n=1 Tax=Ostrea edulis TaxID=37623 RepID=UPI0020941E30|nr:3-phosphoinositide-dependent protein kinase 1-like [Ostrea edulis]XP_048762660.1 3-phosphoinositide-dependent protein kinase 1-like [Ostrea edulis]XP_048762661.1 3-phosphoinositide-dependent protein kinase 1-like [Ostrea edulis]XP_048762662.1 3-phosphoinositide-dependent protein kinase 1-like [Ostrea edulis]